MQSDALSTPVVLYGRRDILDQLDGYLAQLAAPAGPRCGYVFLLGAAGSGASTISRKWAECTSEVPATRIVQLALGRGITSQWIDKRLRVALGPLLVPPGGIEATDSLDEFLQQVAARLSELNERLVLVFDGLDDVETQPLRDFLPRLRPNIYALCATEPTWQVLLAKSARERDHVVLTLDLDAVQFKPSAWAACRERLAIWMQQQSPPIMLDDIPGIGNQILARADGNMLYLQELCSFLAASPRTEWEARLAEVPKQLLSFLKERWNDVFEHTLGSVPHETMEGFLLLLAVAYAPVPADVVRKLLGYSDIDHLLGVARWWVRTEGVDLRLFHGCARDFLQEQLGADDFARWHLRLAQYARDHWQETGSWVSGYALLFAPRHFVEAGNAEDALALALHPEFFCAQVRAEEPGGAWALLDMLTVLAQREERYQPLLDAMRIEAGPLNADPEILRVQLYQRLCSDGFSAGGARDLLGLQVSQPALRLLHPLPATERPRQTLQGIRSPVRSILPGADGRLLSLHASGEINEWDVEQFEVCRSRSWDDTFFPPFDLFAEGRDIFLVDIKAGIRRIVLGMADPGMAAGGNPSDGPILSGLLAAAEDELLQCSIFMGRFDGVTRAGQVLSVRFLSDQQAAPNARYLAYRCTSTGFTLFGVTADGAAGQWTFLPPDGAELAEEPQLQPCSATCDGKVALVGVGSAAGLLYVVRPQEPAGPELLCICRVHAGRQVTLCALSSDGKLALSSDTGGHLVLWSTDSGTPLWKVSLPRTKQVSALCLISGSQEVSLFAGLENGEIWSWNTALSRDGTSAPADDAQPRVPRIDKLLGLSADGRLVALRGSKLLLWGWHDDAPTVIPIPNLNGPLRAKLLSRADGQVVLLVETDGSRHVFYHLQRDQFLSQTIPEDLFRRLLHISPSGSLLLVSDGESGAMLVRLENPEQPIPLVEFSAKGPSVVIPRDEETLIAAEDNHLRIWDSHSGQALATLCTCEPGDFSQLTLSPDGRELLAVTEHGWRRWDLVTRTELKQVSYPAALPSPPLIEACALLSRPSIDARGVLGPEIPCVALVSYAPPWLMVCNRETGECLIRFYSFVTQGGLVCDGHRIAAVDSNGALWRMELRPLHEKQRIYILSSQEEEAREHATDLAKKLKVKKQAMLVESDPGEERDKLPGELDLVIALLSQDALGDDTFSLQWKEALNRYGVGELALLPITSSFVSPNDLMDEETQGGRSRELPLILMADTPLAVLLADAKRAPSAWQEIVSAVEKKIGLPGPAKDRPAPRPPVP